jgi:hypothetical protein
MDAVGVRVSRPEVPRNIGCEGDPGAEDERCETKHVRIFALSFLKKPLYRERVLQTLTESPKHT